MSNENKKLVSFCSDGMYVHERGGIMVYPNAGIAVGGSVCNKGEIKLWDAKLLINKDLVNEGNIKVNDPEKIKEIVLTTLSTAKSVSEFGKSVLEELFK